MSSDTFDLSNGLEVIFDESNLTAMTVRGSKDLKSKDGEFLIPKSFKINNSIYKITDIGEGTFQNNKYIKSVIFSNDSEVKMIGKSAFEGSNISELRLPPQLNYLHGRWCSKTDNLNTITVPNNLKSVKWENNFLIGSSLLCVKPYCNYLDQNFLTGNFLFGSLGLINKQNVLFFSSRSITKAVIPESVNIIGKLSFENCKKLTGLEFPKDSNVEEIKKEAFSGCEKLNGKISFPSKLNKVGSLAFKGNENITMVSFKSNYIVLKQECFYKCSKLKEIKFVDCLNVVLKNGCFDGIDPNYVIVLGVETKVEGIEPYEDHVQRKNPKSFHSALYNSAPAKPKLALLDRKDRYIKYLQNLLTYNHIKFSSIENFESKTKQPNKNQNESNNYQYQNNKNKSQANDVNNNINNNNNDNKNSNNNNNINNNNDSNMNNNNCSKINNNDNNNISNNNNDSNINNNDNKNNSSNIILKNDQSDSIQQSISIESYNQSYDQEDFNETENILDQDENSKQSLFDLSKIHSSICILSDKDKAFYKQTKRIYDTDIYSLWQVTDSRTQQNLSKIILKSKDTYENTCREFDLMHKANHPTICKAFKIGIHEDGQESSANCAQPKIYSMPDQSSSFDNLEPEQSNTFSIYLEDLSQSLKSVIDNNLELKNTLKTQIAIEVLLGLSFMHKAQIFHPGFTIDNVMLNPKFESKIVLFSVFDRNQQKSDNGNAREFNDLDLANFYIYAYGVFLYELFVARKTNDVNKIDLEKIVPNDSISQFGMDLIVKCLKVNEDKVDFDDLTLMVSNNNFALAPDVDSNSIRENFDRIIKFEFDNPPKILEFC